MHRLVERVRRWPPPLAMSLPCLLAEGGISSLARAGVAHPVSRVGVDAINIGPNLTQIWLSPAQIWPKSTETKTLVETSRTVVDIGPNFAETSPHLADTVRSLCDGSPKLAETSRTLVATNPKLAQASPKLPKLAKFRRNRPTMMLPPAQTSVGG